MDVLSWMGIFHPVVNENDFAVAFERHALFKFHDIILRHFTETINAIMKSWNRWSWWSREFGTPTMGEMSFWTKSYHITSVASNVTNPLIFWHVNVIWYVTMILTNTFERKYMALTLTRTFMIHFHWHRNEIVLWYYVMIYGYFFWCSLKGPCDTKSFKISTAYDVWFLRYRPSNLVITADFAMVLVFINLLWAVYGIILWKITGFYSSRWGIISATVVDLVNEIWIVKATLTVSRAWEMRWRVL